MTNPLARLAGQFEGGLADLAKRAAASVADPIKAKGQEVVADVVGAASSAFKGVAIRLGFAVVAVAMLIVALVYLVAAIYWALLPHLGPVETRLVLAGLFALLAIAAAVGMLFWPLAGPSPSSAHRDLLAAQADAQRAAAHVAAATAPHDPQHAAEAGAGDLRSGVEALAAILGEAGYRREQAGLRTGLALAGQLKPMQIASLALIGGYIAGLRYRSRRRR